MDLRLRELEREYLRTGDISLLTSILMSYARHGEQPAGDIFALNALHLSEKFQLSSEERTKFYGHGLTADGINQLAQIGYVSGIYCNVSATLKKPECETISFETIIEMIAHSLIYDVTNQHLDVDSVDNIPITAGNAEGRSLTEQGEPRWRSNLRELENSLYFTPVETEQLLQTMKTWSALLQTKNTKRETRFKIRLFIPRYVLERAYAIQITRQWTGFSRSSRRERANSEISWLTPNQIKKLQTLLFDCIARAPTRFGRDMTPTTSLEDCMSLNAKKLGLNLLLYLSRVIFILHDI